MDKIILAYCRDNADIAQLLEKKLSRIGIPFEHITNSPGMSAGQFTQSMQHAAGPVILLITDNFLKNANCMFGATDALKHLIRLQRVLPIVADGYVQTENTATPERISTQFERVIHAIQYMNFWQSNYMEIRAKKENAAGQEVERLSQQIDVTKAISQEIGDYLNTLRDSGYVSYANFEANDFEMFFRKFGITEWHGQYRTLAAFDDDKVKIINKLQEPEPIQVAEMVVEKQAIPMEDLAFVPPANVAEMPENSHQIDAATHLVEDDFSHIRQLIEEITLEEIEQENLPNFENSDLEKAVEENVVFPEMSLNPEAIVTIAPSRMTEMPNALQSQNGNEEHLIPEVSPDMNLILEDANFWFEKGHSDKGLRVLEAALAQNPHNTTLLYEKIYSLIKHTENPKQALGELETARENDLAEHLYFDLRGELAFSKGDFLLAKENWDLVAALKPTYPNIFVKLADLSENQFHGFDRVTKDYLKLAVRETPENSDLHYRLAKIYQEKLHKPKKAVRSLMNTVASNPKHAAAWLDLGAAYLNTADAQKAETCLQNAVQLDPTLSESITKLKNTEPEIVAKKTVLTVLITGATSGIGKATAELFAQHGHRLILTGRRSERLAAIREEFYEKYGNEVHTLCFDVRDYAAAKTELSNLPLAFENIDLLLNNAGLAKGLDFIHEGNLEHWETMIDTNLKGLLYVTRLVAPGMVARKSGHIINIGSSAGKEVYQKGAVYCATKFAVDALSRSMRLDLHTHNIRVSQVSPGHVEETEFALTRFDGNAERAKIYNDFQPLRAEDVAETIYFIATRPAHVNIQDIYLFCAQQASATVIDRSGRELFL